jgi:hypothetical protein
MRKSITIDTAGKTRDVNLAPNIAGLLYVFHTREEAVADAGDSSRVLELEIREGGD